MAVEPEERGTYEWLVSEVTAKIERRKRRRLIRTARNSVDVNCEALMHTLESIGVSPESVRDTKAEIAMDGVIVSKGKVGEDSFRVIYFPPVSKSRMFDGKNGITFHGAIGDASIVDNEGDLGSFTKTPLVGGNPVSISAGVESQIRTSAIPAIVVAVSRKF